MRFLHTSDWHLGRSFHGVGMLDAQRCFIDQLVDTVRNSAVDVVLVAGDVYDRALPGVDVVRLLNEALVRLRAAGASVVISSGNHDSAVRLGFGAGIMELGGVHLRTGLSELDRPVVFHEDGFEVAVYGIPYLEPRLCAQELETEPHHADVTRSAVGRIREELSARRRDRPATAVHSVVMAHTFASGGITSDSERDLSVGGVGAVPLDLFDGFNYTALGHLHGQQRLSDSVRYSGSPLPYSFSEARQTKGGYLLDVDQSGVTSLEPVTWAATKSLAVLKGTLEDLLANPAHSWAEEAYCQVTLTDRQRPAKAMESVRTRFPETLVLAFAPADAGPAQHVTYSQKLAAAESDLDVCCGFLEHVRSREASSAEAEALTRVLDTVRSAEVGA